LGWSHLHRRADPATAAAAVKPTPRIFVAHQILSLGLTRIGLVLMFDAFSSGWAAKLVFPEEPP